MTTNEAFRLGFFYRCAEAGLSPEEVSQLASRLHEKRAGDWTDTAGMLGGLGLGVTLAAPPILGYMTGSGLANASHEDVDPETLKKQELIAEYRRLATRARFAALKRRLREEQHGL